MARIPIRSRTSWGAQRPRCRTAQDPGSVHTMYLHYPAASGTLAHLDSDSEQEAWLRGIQAFHMGPERGWCDIGYNYACFQDGTLYRLRGLKTVPAAQAGANTNTVAVLCVVGNDERPTDAMKRALRRLKDEHLDRRTGRDLTVKGHGQGPGQQTSCPGPHLLAFVPELNRS